MSNPRGRAARAMHEVFAPISYHSTQQYACQLQLYACQLLLMRACARRAYCMTDNFRGQVHGKSFNSDSRGSADSSINPAKTPRYGKSTVVYREIFIHRMLMIRVSVRRLRMREIFLFYEYSIFNFAISRCILHFLGKNRTHAICYTIVH